MAGLFEFINWWGMSPALDLQDEFFNLSSKFQKLEVVEPTDDDKEPDVFNIFLLGAGDCRYILKTLAHAKRHPKKIINVYVLEHHIDLLARHLLLLSIALESQEKLVLQEKTELFLELFGNSLIRPQTSEYLQNRSDELIRMVTDLDYLEACLPCIKLEHLKFLDRDNLESVLKFWRNTNPKLFSMEKEWWMNGLFKKGYDRRLEPDDLYEVLEEDSSETVTAKLEEKLKEQPSLAKASFKLVRWKLLLTGLVGLTKESCQMALAFFLLFLVSYFNPNSSIPKLNAYMYALGLMFMTLMSVITHQIYYFITRRMGMQLRVAVTGLIYKKALRLSPAVPDKVNTGYIINLISTDAQKFDECFIMIHYLWIGLVQLVVTTYLLWRLIGPSCFVGISISLLLIPYQTWLGHMFGVLRNKTAVLSDERCRLMNEILTGIRVIKMYVWELPYSALVRRIRRKEISKIMQSSFIKAADRGTEFAFHSLLSFLMFTTYVLLGNTLSAATVFSSLALLNRLIVSTGKHFPYGMKKLSETRISVRRIQEFLELEELQYDRMTKLNPRSGEKGIIVNSIAADWDKSTGILTLENISFEIGKGDLLMAVGPVGSGKTSLLMSILGDLPLIKGDIKVRGKIGYAAQKPWIFSGTIKQNILFGQNWIESRYKRVIRACALEKDIDLMPEGDMTLVGEKGLALSGGQKARINLARVVYYNADIYLLDDPLSSVDSRVARHLFDECINGLLKECPRILVTHQLQFLNQASQILCLKEGRVLGLGTHTELASSGIDLISLIKTKAQDDDRDSAIDDETSESHLLLPVVKVDDKRSSSTNVLFRRSFTSSTELQLEIDGDEGGPVSDVELDPEERPRGNIPISVYTKLFSAGANCCVLLFLFLCFAIAQGAYTLGDWWLAHWSDINSRYSAKQQRSSLPSINSSSTPSAPVEYNQYFYISVFAGLVVITLLFSLLKAFLFFYVKVNASRKLHDAMFESVLRLPSYFFDTNPVGRIMNRFSKDIGFMDDLLPESFYEFLHLSVVSISIVIVNVVSMPWILIGIVPLIAVFVFLRTYYLKTAREVKRLEAIGRSPVFNHFSSTLEGVTTIRSMSSQKLVSHQLSRCQNHHTEAWFLYMAASRWFACRLEFLCFLFVTMAAFSPLLIAEKQTVDEGVVGLALTYAIVLTGMFQWCVRVSAEVENQMTSVERVLEYCRLDPEGDWTKPNEEVPSAWPIHGLITAEKLSLQYHPSLPRVLKNMYFCIRAKEKVGIVGRTGAGKSSLMAALLRMVEPTGSIRIDGIDITEIGLHDLRSKISVIPQDPVLFGGTLRYNLDPFDEYPDRDLWIALNEVELSRVIHDLPGGLETTITESGSNFSVGQRQLICLARALLRHNAILIVDEATSHVDTKTDALIQQTIRKKFKDCTVLTIAHRLNTIIDCDRVMVLESGRLVEFDEPCILLLDQDSAFSRLVEQTGKENAANLMEMAKRAYESQHSPQLLDYIPEHLRSNLRAYLPSSGFSALQIESTL